MGFGNVDDQETCALLVLLVELVESGNLPPEGRSSIAAENQHYRLLLAQVGKLNASGLVEFEQ
jgi:hypothetical protein